MSSATEDVKTALVIKWLQECFVVKEAGRQIPRNLNYKSRRGILTDEYVERLVAVIEEEFIFELEKYPDYHYRNANGANTPPGFTKMSFEDKRAMVEGLDRVLGYEDA